MWHKDYNDIVMGEIGNNRNLKDIMPICTEYELKIGVAIYGLYRSTGLVFANT